MKKYIKILITIILLVITFLCVYNFLKDKLYAQGATLSLNGEDTDGLKISISGNEMKSVYDNVYSVDYQQLVLQNTGYTFEAAALAKIRGEKVTFTNYYSGSTDYTTKNITTTEGTTCLENNIMAAIASGEGVSSKGYKYTKNGEYYSSGAQLAIWEFWNTWVQNSGANSNGFDKGIGNGTITENGLNGEVERKEAQKLANTKDYNVNIYFLKYLAHNNTNISEDGDSNVENQANLILIEQIDEFGDPIQSENIVEDKDIFLSVTNNFEGFVAQVGEEITYIMEVYNKNEEVQQNLVLNNTWTKGVEFVEVSEIVGDTEETEVKLNENVDYTYNAETRKLTINIDKIEGVSTEDEETIMNSKKYKIKVKASKLEDGVYIQNVKNTVDIQKDGKVLTKITTTSTISDAVIVAELDQLPKSVKQNDEVTIGVKLTNKGLIDAYDIKAKISIPEEILMSTYRESILAETKEESVIEGTVTNEYENNSIDIPPQKTFYIKLYGTINETTETKQITIKGTVNGQEMSWTTTIQGGY